MSDEPLSLDATLGTRMAPMITEARRLLGWSQAVLAAHAKTSQSMISRLEAGKASPIDVLVIERVLRALGMRITLQLEARHLDDRRRQHDGVHARLLGYEDRRLQADAWGTELEADITAEDRTKGWIDLLAFREADCALLVNETKGDIEDMGALQRSLAFYQREAWAVARRLGWRPRSVTVLCVALDSEAVAARIGDNRQLVSRVFPARVADTAAWLASPTAERPMGWTLAVADPLYRGRHWLRSTVARERRTAPAYRNYADAAGRILRS